MFKNVRGPVTENVLTYAREKMPGMAVVLQAKCLFWLLKAFYFPIFLMFLSTCKTLAILFGLIFVLVVFNLHIVAQVKKLNPQQFNG